MTTAATLLALAQRCETEQPGIALDGAIWCAINGYEFIAWDGGGARYRDASSVWGGGYVRANEIKPFTRSLDAAVTLIPPVTAEQTSFWRVGNDGEGASPADFKAEVLVCNLLVSKQGVGITEAAAAALCAAALRARAVMARVGA